MSPPALRPLLHRTRRLPEQGSISRAAGPLLFLVVGGAYLALAQFVLWLNDPANVGASLWFASGLSLGALLLAPPRLWGWVLSAVALAEFGGDLALGYPPAATLGWTLANTVEPLVGAVLLRRFGNPRGALVPVRNLLLFLALAVVAAPLVGGTIGATATALGVGGTTYAEVWPRYVVGDALGVLIVAPVILTWRTPFSRRSRVEVAALFGGALAVGLVIFSGDSGDFTQPLAYLLIPFLVWAGLRHGMRVTAQLAFAVTIVANWFTAEWSGPFALGEGGDGHAVPLLQVFLGVSVSSAFLVAALVDELSDRDEVERALRHQAEHDALTGLPNRARLASAIEAALDGPLSGGEGIALLVCDIDHLKAVNDSLGHRAGDEFIAHIARRLTRSVRAGDLVSRISGDEFVVVLRDVDAVGVDALCERIIANVTPPVVLRAHTEVTPSLSIGVALGRPGMSGEEMFNGADTALYEAKRRGRGRTAHFDDSLRLAARERVELETDLPRAISHGQIRCVYQPEIVLATGEVFAFESLARWHHPRRGGIDPEVFVPVADAIGNAAALFDHVLAQTLAVQGGWYAATGFRPAVAVNVSALQLRDPGLPRSVAQALAAAGAPADSLWLELTETAQAGDTASAALADLAGVGVHLALDDFGTGWSSMARLSEFPWEVVKLDRSFIGRLGADDDADHVVRAMIDMAHALGIRVVAEGVETAAQLDRLRVLGCDIAQGFLFSRPVDAGRVAASMAADGMWRDVRVRGTAGS